MNMTKLTLKNVVITDHAKQRAKQRMLIKADPNSLEFVFKLKEEIIKSQFRGVDRNSLIFELIHNNTKFEVIAIPREDKYLIQTIIERGR
ncbi:MAG: hypothetical protein ACRC4L_03030 [Mycoplasma sp.]